MSSGCPTAAHLSTGSPRRRRRLFNITRTGSSRLPFRPTLPISIFHFLAVPLGGAGGLPVAVRASAFDRLV